jgi:hypothetical protein
LPFNNEKHARYFVTLIQKRAVVDIDAWSVRHGELKGGLGFLVWKGYDWRANSGGTREIEQFAIMRNEQTEQLIVKGVPPTW